MKTIFNLKISYLNQADNGSIYKKTEEYAVEALSFTEAEANLQAALEETIPEYNLQGISKTGVSNVYTSGSLDDTFFKIKISYPMEDADTGKTKEIKELYLVQDATAQEATARLEATLEGSIIAVEFDSIVKTKIVEFFGYKE